MHARHWTSRRLSKPSRPGQDLQGSWRIGFHIATLVVAFGICGAAAAVASQETSGHCNHENGSHESGGHESGGHDHDSHGPGAHDARSEASESASLRLSPLPDATLLDQNGQAFELRRWIGDRRAIINFIFTSCTTVCPPMGALFAELQRDLESRPEDVDVAYLSISIDPAQDTPEKLKTWASRFGGSERWRLATGPKPVIDALLKELGVFTALKEEHTPLVLIGDGKHEAWIRAHGLAPPSELIAILDRLAQATPAAAQTDAAKTEVAKNEAAKSEARRAEARDYFTDTILVDQDGYERRLYSDLIADRTVVINPFFATCTGSCPVMHRALRQAQDALGERLGRDVFFLSITVDPRNDTPQRLRAWAQAFGASAGWTFLTGSQSDVDRVLGRLGQQVTQKEAHQAIFLVGNERTGLWQKVFGLGPPETLLEAIRQVADDKDVAAAQRTDPRKQSFPEPVAEKTR